MRRSKRLQDKSQPATGSGSQEPENLAANPVDAQLQGDSAEIVAASLSDVPDTDFDVITEELHKALQGDFKFNGDFYHAQALPSAPNPCLIIQGIGTVGLPLSDRDAKAIIKVAKQAPFGHGSKTVVDKKVRNKWEVEPASIQFENPEWEKYVKDTVRTTVCKALGAWDTTSHPRMELYKLLLYETGSHFLPHQDTEKASGMFATVVVLLPSRYTGGQVHVTSGLDIQVIDLSSKYLSTSVLAWYADVLHEVKPITSGYRLALSYNLIRTSATPIPRPPSMDQAVLKLRQILRKWLKSTLENETHEEDFLTCLLKHQYNNINLLAGTTSLKGQDARLVAHVRVAAKDLGIEVYLGALTYSQAGTADDDHYGRYRHGSDHQVGFEEVQEEELYLAHVVDLDGKLIVNPQHWTFDEKNLVPKEPFDGLKPDKQEYEGYMGNGAGGLQQWYHRTAVMLVHKSYADAVFLEADGLKYALTKLKTPNAAPLSQEDEVAIISMVRKLKLRDWDYMGTNMRTFDSWMERTLKWKSAEVWKEVVLKFHKTTESLDDGKIKVAAAVFKFEEMRPGFEELLRRPQPLCSRNAFIGRIQALFSAVPSIGAWCNTELSNALKGIAPTSQDVPILVDVTLKRGITFLATEVLPHIKTSAGTFDFITKFISAVHEKKASILPNPRTDESVKEWNAFMDQCLHLAVNQWNIINLSELQWNQSAINLKLAPLERLFSYCLLLRRTQPRQALVDQLVSLGMGDHASNVAPLLTRLLPTLIQLCQRNKVNLLSPPFDTLLQVTVETHLQHVLGPPPSDAIKKIRNMGCTCHDCAGLNQFLKNVNATHWSDKVYVTVRRHWQPLFTAMVDMLTVVHSTGPTRTTITKRPEMVAAQKWQVRASAARGLLKTIGNDEEIARLMGSRIVDVRATLEGRQAYSRSCGEDTSGGAVNASESGAVPKRRKLDGNEYVDCGLIDLT